jgi:hypothetical protein
MRQNLAEIGVLLIALAALMLWAIIDWQVGPEFWPAVPTFALLGALILREAL